MNGFRMKEKPNESSNGAWAHEWNAEWECGAVEIRSPKQLMKSKCSISDAWKENDLISNGANSEECTRVKFFENQLVLVLKHLCVCVCRRAARSSRYSRTCGPCNLRLVTKINDRTREEEEEEEGDKNTSKQTRCRPTTKQFNCQWNYNVILKAVQTKRLAKEK